MMLKKYLTGFSLLIVFILAGYGYYLYQSSSSVRNPLIVTDKVQEAVSSPDLILVVHMVFDYKAFVRGEPDSNLPAIFDNALTKLTGRGIGDHGSVTSVTGNLFQNPAGQFTSILILSGEFNSEVIRQELLKEDGAQSIQVDATPIIRLSNRNMDACDPTPPVSVHISDSRILIGDQSRVIEALSEDAPTHNTGFTHYPDFRKHKILALFVRNPSSLVNTLPINSAIAEIQLGLAMPEKSMNGELTVNILSDQPSAINDMYNSANKVVSLLRVPRTHKTPSFEKVSHLSLTHTETGLTIHAAVPKSLFNNIDNVAGDFVSGLVAGYNAISSNMPSAIATPLTNPTQSKKKEIKEILDPNPGIFINKSGHEKLAMFNNSSSHSGNALTISGPFGVNITSIRINDDNSHTLSLSASGTGIPNLNDNANRSVFRIKEVSDENGESLLKEVSCGPNRYKLESGFTRGNATLISSTLNLTLKEHASLEDIHEISGVIELNFPENAKTTEIELGAITLPHTVKLGENLSLVVVKNRPLLYQVKGESDSILSAVGLNKNHERLLRRYLSGKTKENGVQEWQADYAGQTRYIQFIYANNIEKREYPFTISNAAINSEIKTPQMPDKQAYVVNPETFESLVAPVTNTANPAIKTGPFAVERSQVDYFDGIYLTFIVRSNNVPGLRDTDNVARLAIDGFKLDNGTVIDTGISAGNLAVTELHFIRDWKNAGMMRATGYFLLKNKIKPERIKSLRGRVLVDAPVKINQVTISPAKLGATAHNNNAKVTIEEVNMRGYVLDIQPNSKPVIQIYSTSDTDKHFLAQVTKTPPGKNDANRYIVNSSQATTLTVVSADEQKSYVFPFEIKF
jgi:hypothetical protein